MTDDQRLTDRLAALVADEPPFETDLGNALWAAETGGRRYRNRSAALRATTVVLAAAAASAVALVVWWPTAPKALPPQPARSTSITTAVLSPTAPSKTPDELLLRQLAAQLAAQVGGEVEITRDQNRTEGIGFTAHVLTAAGPVEIQVGQDPDPDGVADGRSLCRENAEDRDQKICRVLLDHDTIGIWAWRHTDDERRRLQASAVTPEGGTLAVTINNDIEEPDGDKVIGPNWEQAGITMAGVRAAIADSGLALPDRAGTSTTAPANASDETAVRAIAARIAAQVDGEVEIHQTESGARFVGYQARVQTSAGLLLINVNKDQSPDGLAESKDSCRPTADNPKPCVTWLDHDTIAIYEFSYTKRTGSRHFWATAAARDGGTVMVIIDNDSERPGPNWETAGITVAEVRAAIADSGLAAPDA